MRIGVDASVFRTAPTGIARYLAAMLTELMALDAGLEFVLYSPSRVELTIPEGNWRLRIGDSPTRRVAAYWLQRSLPGMLLDDGVEVFWGQNHHLPLRLRRPCFRLLTLHDVTAMLCPQTMPLRSRIAARAILRRAMVAADCIIADSAATIRLATRLVAIQPGRIRLIAPGVGPGFCPYPADLARRAVRDRYGIDEEYMLAVGTIEPRKNHVTLLRALQLLPEAPVLAIVGGKGWHCRDVVAQIGRLERAGRVRYLGRVTDADMPAMYSAARLLVFPSLYEGFGLPIAEAMACGCPVLCSWSSSLPEVAGDAAVYFRTRDACDLASKARSLLADEDTLARMSARGLELVSRFSFRNAAVQLLGILRAAVPRRRSSPAVAGRATSGSQLTATGGALPSAADVRAGSGEMP